MVEHQERIKDFFSDYYVRADKGGWIPPVAEEVDRVCRMMNLRPKPGQKALDFSCGEGRNTRYLCDIGYAVTATDVIDQPLEVNRKRLGNRNATLEKITLSEPLNYADGAFHLILAFHTLQWLGSKEQFTFYLREFARVMADDGHLIFTMPSERNYHTAMGKEIGGGRYEVMTEQRRGCVQYSPDRQSLIELIDEEGFETKLFGRHEFGYEGYESTVDSPLSMFVFCVQKRT